MHYRPTRPSDIPRVMDLLRSNPRWHPDPSLLPIVEPFLRELLRPDGELGGASVVFQTSESAPLACVAIGVFVHAEFMDRLLAAPQPYYHREFYRSVARGQHPVLSSREVAESNARGDLHTMSLHYVQRIHDPLHDDNAELRPLGYPSFALNYAGYGLRRFLFETYGEVNHRYLATTGMRKVVDFSDHPSVRALHADSRPAWSMLKRGDPPCMGPMLADFFAVPAPKLGLTPAQQRTVLGALRGLTDREIAEHHQISLHAVRQSWNGIFDRCNHMLPGANGSDSGSVHRGPERRRKVIDYLGTHMAELRPYRAAARNGDC